MEVKAHILLVEDDQNFGSVLKAYLEMNGFTVSWIDDGKDALKAFSASLYDICILDVMLPNIDGLTIAHNIKMLNPAIPFIFLTAKTLKEDILKGYAAGADDYVTKPFDSEVLICKIDAVLTRGNDQKILSNQVESFNIGKYTFNYNVRQLIKEGKIQKLSPKESELLKLLCQNQNTVLPREVALRSIWGEESYFTTRSMDVFITKLRKYLKEDKKIEIVNIHGNGFRLSIYN
ncbi:MAG: response regulator transcription factor [Bacteroidales bacterium]|nr:response regulator transcription factor [Bacteroidales bacterium]